MVCGSVWTQTANQIIGIQVTLDSKVIGTAEIYSNQAVAHRTVVTSYLPVQLQVQTTHTLTLTVLNSHTVSDFNDFFEVVLDY